MKTNRLNFADKNSEALEKSYKPDGGVGRAQYPWQERYFKAESFLNRLLENQSVEDELMAHRNNPG